MNDSIDNVELRERIHASASEREGILADLSQIHFDAAALERQTQYERDLTRQIRKLRRKVEETRRTAETERKSRDDQHSGIKALANKIKRKASKAASPDASPRPSFSESATQSFEAQRELERLEETRTGATQELARLEAAARAYGTLVAQLDPIYETIFASVGWAAMAERALMQPIQYARSMRNGADERLQVEEGVLKNLRKAENLVKQMAPELSQLLVASQWQGWVMGGRFAAEDKSMEKLVDNIAQADTWILDARTQKEEVAVEPLAIDYGGVARKDIFKKIVWDIEYYAKMEDVCRQLKRKQTALRAEIANGEERRAEAETDSTIAKKDITQARQKRVKETEALIAQIYQAE